MRWLGLFTSVILLSGCAGQVITQDLQVSRKYKRDISITVDPLSTKGVMVLPKSPSYKISIRSPDQMDALLVQTCHREIIIEGAGREHTINYVPIPGLEDVGSCPIYLSGLTKKKERISLGFIDFYSGQSLKAWVSCSGEVGPTYGVSICQAPEGLWQSIKFEEEVRFIEPEGKCATEIKSDGKLIKFKMPNADCVMVFKGTSGALHKANWLGFDDYVLRSQ